MHVFHGIVLEPKQALCPLLCPSLDSNVCGFYLTDIRDTRGTTTMWMARGLCKLQ